MCKLPIKHIDSKDHNKLILILNYVILNYLHICNTGLWCKNYLYTLLGFIINGTQGFLLTKLLGVKIHIRYIHFLF